MHVRGEIMGSASLRAEYFKRGRESSGLGTHDPLPKRIREEGHEVAIPVPDFLSIQVRLQPGICPRLADRFPRFVKTATPT